MVANLNELHVNANVVAFAPYAAFERILDMECAANLSERFPGDSH